MDQARREDGVNFAIGKNALEISEGGGKGIEEEDRG